MFNWRGDDNDVIIIDILIFAVSFKVSCFTSYVEVGWNFIYDWFKK